MIEKYIITDNLPQRKQGLGVDWEKCSGMSVSFKYKELIGEFIVVEYDKKNKRIYFKYNDELMSANINSFKNCSLGVNLKIISRENAYHFKYDIGYKIKKNGFYLIILDRKVKQSIDKNGYKRYEKIYKIKCGHCGKVSWRKEYEESRYGCQSCSQAFYRVESSGSIVDTDQWMIPYFQGGVEEAGKYTSQSNQSIYPICPDCGRVKNKKLKINTIYKNKSIGCSCSDKVSYPEKFMFNILEQLKVDFIWQLSNKTFGWCNDLRYDFYDKNLNIIIETHGGQHKRGGWVVTSEEQKRIDENKKDLAIKNNISDYIELDCSKSNMEYIKESILNSKLSLIYNLDKIDWMKADKFALNNFIKHACEYFEHNKNELFMFEIENDLKIADTTLVGYLKKGSRHGWCNYNPKEMRDSIYKKRNYKGCRHVYFAELNCVFKSASQIADMSESLLGVKLASDKIQYVCNGLYESHRGFHFAYTDENNQYNKYKIVSNIDDVSTSIDMDWTKYSNNFTISKLIKEVCGYYEDNKDKMLMKDIANNFNIGIVSLIKWLKIGKENGICSYIPSK